ncbi:LytR C-terminal domain-containing protein [Patescibacteria group bacterium]|nr:LytR C-terminal domain-containing protein [Patescibacteria group bacterium]MCL5797525.1 LytR C-terminal domain-containing protein [Patescibacteria group bacterium]
MRRTTNRSGSFKVRVGGGKSNPRQRIPKLIIWCLAIILLLSGFISLNNLNKWDGSNRLTVVLNSDPMAVFTIDPVKRQAYIAVIPEETMLYVPYGYGEYKASSVYKLGELDKKRPAGVLLERSVENSFDILIDGYIATKGVSFPFPIKSSKDIAAYKSKYFSFLKLPGIALGVFTGANTLDTNLTKMDLMRLYLSIASLRSDQIRLVNLGDRSVLRDDKLPDGTSVKVIDTDILASVIQDNFQDQAIRTENVTLEIVNASGQNQLAGQFGKILRNIGANVLVTTTAQNDVSFACVIYFTKDSLKTSYIVTKLKKRYGCKISEIGNSSDMSNQTDIQVVLGEDFVK